MRRVLSTVGALGVALTMGAGGVAFADEEDEPVSVPFEDMTEEEAARMDARDAEFEAAAAQWRAFYQGLCAANADHEQRLAEWRVAAEAYNNDPTLPSPGSRPELVVPVRPSIPQPAAMTIPDC